MFQAGNLKVRYLLVPRPQLGGRVLAYALFAPTLTKVFVVLGAFFALQRVELIRAEIVLTQNELK